MYAGDARDNSEGTSHEGQEGSRHGLGAGKCSNDRRVGISGWRRQEVELASPSRLAVDDQADSQPSLTPVHTLSPVERVDTEPSVELVVFCTTDERVLAASPDSWAARFPHLTIVLCCPWTVSSLCRT